MEHFHDFVTGYLDLLQEAKKIPLGQYVSAWPELPPDAPVAVILSAHPDDEVMTGMPLGIRLRRAGYRIVNIAVTVGSPDQYERRLQELQGACTYLGIQLVVPLIGGLRGQIKSNCPQDWQYAVDEITNIIKPLRPKVVITHHEGDAHHDHIAVSKLTHQVLLKELPALDCVLACGEYWRDLQRPNLQLEVSAGDLAILLEGLSFHKGELARNPYHLLWPAFMSTKVRYGEIVKGWGTGAPSFDFSVMYRLKRSHDGALYDYLSPTQLGADQPIELILPRAN